MRKRFITLLLVICLCFGLVPATTYAATAPASTAKVYKWKQTDSRWNKYYSAQWSQGCAVTAIAVQIARTDLVRVNESASSFNTSTGIGFNPGTFAKAFAAAKGTNKSLSVTWAYTNKVVPGFKNVTTKNVLKSIDSKTPNRSSAGWHYFNASSKSWICKCMKYYLDHGYYPVIEGPGSRWSKDKTSVHYVAVVKATTSDVKVVDPATGTEKSLFDVSVGGNRWNVTNIEKCGIPKGYGSCRLYSVDKSKTPSNLISTPTDPASVYLAKCTKTANTCVSIKVSGSSSDYLKTLPCAKKTSSASKSVRKLVEGETLIATAIYKNTAGNYWYKVKADSDGKVGYVYGAITKLNGTNAPKGACTGGPSLSTTTPKYGNPYTISGTMKTTDLTIIAVSASLRDSNDKMLQYKLVQNLNTKSYKLASSPIDKNLKFGKLPRGRGNIAMTVALSAKYIDGNTVKNTTIKYYPARYYYTVK